MTDNQQTERKLLPCPFCGDSPKLHTWSDHDYVRIECESCCFEWDYFHNVDDAADNWNRRPSPPALDDMLEHARLAEFHFSQWESSQYPGEKAHSLKYLRGEMEALRAEIAKVKP